MKDFFLPGSNLHLFKAPLLAALCLLLSLSSGQLQQPLSPTTVFDGVTTEKYVTYLNLTSSQEATLDISTINMNSLQPYTIMLWFKVTHPNFPNQAMSLFRFQGSINCRFTSYSTVICDSSDGSINRLETNASSIFPGMWTHITISGTPSSGSQLQIESNVQNLTFVQGSYVHHQQTMANWQAYLGSQGMGFQGGLRDFVWFNTNIDGTTISRIKNNLLLADAILIAYYRFTEANFLNDQTKPKSASISAYQSINIGRDYIPNDICSTFLDQQGFQKIGPNGGAIQTGNSWQIKLSGWSFSSSVWLKISRDTCTNSDSNSASSSCYIFKLDQAVMMFMPQPGQVAFHFFAKQPYQAVTTTALPIVYNEWVNVQMVSSQYSGYQIAIYDILGRQIQSKSNGNTLYQQYYLIGKASLMQSYSGLASNFQIWSSKQSLPISGVGNIVNQDFQGSNVQTYGPNVILSGSGATQGLVSYPVDLFDGVACNDQDKYIKLNSKSSYYKGTSQNTTQVLNSVSVEFWFKAQNSLSSMDFLFSLWSSTTQHEFFNIYYDQTAKMLTCAPFANTSAKAPFLQFINYTEYNRIISGWFHITCQYQKSTQVTGYLYSQFIDATYVTPLSQQSTDVLPSGTFTFFVGNNRSLNRGTEQLIVREVRVWGSLRTVSQIQDWRFKSIDPRLSTNRNLLVNFRANDAYTSDINFVNPNSSSALVNTDVFYNDYTIVSDFNLTVCPMSTYVLNMTCYLNPVVKIGAGVYPILNQTDNSLYWVFSSNETTFISQAAEDQILANWRFQSRFISIIANSQLNQSMMTISGDAFKEDTSYTVFLTITNYDRTFSAVYTLNFGASACQFYTVTGGDSYTNYNVVTNAAVNDLQISMSLQNRFNNCANISFYNMLVPSISYNIFPDPNKPVPINIVVNPDSTISATILRKDQVNFAQMQDYKIQFTLLWTNALYSNFVDSSDYSSHMVLYTLRFQNIGQTCVPSLTVSTAFALIGDTVTFDASQTYLTQSQPGQQQQNLTFSWICPQTISSLCLGATNSTFPVTWSSFNNSGGLPETNYTFQVQVSWNNGASSPQLFTQSINCIWHNVSDPDFTLSQPSTILVTNSNQFQVVLNSSVIMNTQLLNVSWIFNPPINASLLTLGNNNMNLTVQANGFLTNQSYTLLVILQNTQYTVAKRNYTIQFQTKFPPYGGSQAITPNNGVVSETNFTASISNWQTSFPPVQFRVRSSSYSGKYYPDQILTNWTAANLTTQFQAINLYPLFIEITDASLETIFAQISIIITQNSSQTPTTNLMSTGNSEASTIASIAQYNFMSDSLSSQNVSQDLAQSFLAYLSQDIENLVLPRDANNGMAAIVIGAGVQIVSKALKQYNTPAVANSAFLILNNINQYPDLFPKVLQMYPNFTQNFADALSSLYQYSSSSENKRNLAELSQQDIRQMVGSMKNDFFSQVCFQIPTTETEIQIQSTFFDITVERFDTSTQVHQRQYQLDGVNGQDVIVSLNVSQVINDIVWIQPSTLSVCSLTTFYKQNPYPLSQAQNASVSEYSSVFVEQQLRNNLNSSLVNAYNPSSYVDQYYLINQETFSTNQTMCFVYYPTLQQWSSLGCQTQLDLLTQGVHCQCDIERNQIYTLMNDRTRQQNQTLAQIMIITPATISPTSLNISILSVLLFLLFVGVFVPVFAFIQDKKDLQYTKNLTEQKKNIQLIELIAGHMPEMIQRWSYKQEDIENYLNQGKTLFSHLFNQIHPLARIFTKYDAEVSRFARFSIYFIQICIYALSCILVFGPAYRRQDSLRLEEGLDQQDLIQILMIGAVGMVFLLPLPFSDACLRFRCNKKRTIQTRANSERSEVSELAEQQNKNTISIISMSIFVYLTLGGVLAVGGYFSQKLQVSSQYCIVASFYIGFIGSIFITNILRISFNALILKKALNNQCFRAFASAEAIQMLRDIFKVREMQAKLDTNELEDKGLTLKRINKESEDCINNPCKIVQESDFSSHKMDDPDILSMRKEGIYTVERTEEISAEDINPPIELESDRIHSHISHYSSKDARYSKCVTAEKCRDNLPNLDNLIK